MTLKNILGRPGVGVGLLILIGISLILHPLRFFIQDIIAEGGASGSQWLTMLGWVYLITGVIGTGVIYSASSNLTPLRVLGATLLTFPLFIVLFSLDLFFITNATNSPLDFAFLVFPVAVALPIGITIRTRQWNVLLIGVFTWFISWSFVIGYVFDPLNLIHPLVFLFISFSFALISIFSVPVLISGLLVGEVLMAEMQN